MENCTPYEATRDQCKSCRFDTLGGINWESCPGPGLGLEGCRYYYPKAYPSVKVIYNEKAYTNKEKGLGAYLAGPIDACSYQEATGWRKTLTYQLADLGIQTLDPTRSYKSKFGLSGEWLIDTIVECDMQDLIDADCVIAYVPRGVEIIGTAMEICITNRILNKPVYVVSNRGDRLSPWVQYHATKIFPDLGELVEWLAANRYNGTMEAGR